MFYNPEVLFTVLAQQTVEVEMRRWMRAAVGQCLLAEVGPGSPRLEWNVDGR